MNDAGPSSLWELSLPVTQKPSQLALHHLFVCLSYEPVSILQMQYSLLIKELALS